MQTIDVYFAKCPKISEAKKETLRRQQEAKENKNKYNTEKNKKEVKDNRYYSDNNKFKINIYEINLYFYVIIDTIKIKEIKNYFTIPSEEKYAKPKYENRYQMYGFFILKNPYNKEYVEVPIDSDFKGR